MCKHVTTQLIGTMLKLQEWFILNYSMVLQFESIRLQGAMCCCKRWLVKTEKTASLPTARKLLAWYCSQANSRYPDTNKESKKCEVQPQDVQPLWQTGSYCPRLPQKEERQRFRMTTTCQQQGKTNSWQVDSVRSHVQEVRTGYISTIQALGYWSCFLCFFD